MSKTSNFAMFVIGAGLGAVAAWVYAKKKYEQIAQEEIESVKEVYSKKEQQKHPEENPTSKNSATKEEKSKYADVVNKLGYTNYSDVKSSANTTSEEEANKIDAPYVISPNDFGEFEDYGEVSLTYYADKVLADENDELVEDADNVVGFESLNHFGEYEEDSVCVRNDRLKCDYEILLDPGKYSDVLKMRPHQREE